ncbi:MAG TPA: hypothetical protein VGR31_10490 [Planctomycetota bacterium]|nr:hypothetical protein [Planctomycetota bacterium]
MVVVGEAVEKLLVRLLDSFAPKDSASKQGGKDHSDRLDSSAETPEPRAADQEQPR